MPLDVLKRPSPSAASQLSEPSVFAEIAELKRLIDAALEPDPEENEVFLGTPEYNRRRDRRQPFLAELVVVLMAEPDDDGRTMRFVLGWTQNLSPGGVGFVVQEKLPEGKHLLLIRHPDYESPKVTFIGSLIWEQQSGSDWEYGAAIRPCFRTREELDLLATAFSR